MTSGEEIKSWLESGIADGSKYVLIYCDEFDYSDYPVYAENDDEFWRQYDNPLHQSANMQRLMEVYDLSMDIEKQLDEYRAMHMPERVPVA